MKKLLVLTVTALCLSIFSHAQLGGLLKKKNNTGGGPSASGGKEQLMEDEPGTIFGNYYWVFLTSKNANAGYMNELRADLPKEGQTLQLKRFEAGKDEVAIIGYGGMNKGAYTYNESRCAGCEAVNKIGHTSYKGVAGASVEGNPNNVESAAPVFKEDLKTLKESVLSIGFLGSKYMGFGKADFYIVMSKDKSKLEGLTYESMATLGEQSVAAYAEALKATDLGVTMMKPGTANKAPIFAKARAAAPQALKVYLSGKGITHLEPVYAYEYFNNPGFDVIKNNIQQEIGRQVQFYVVCKNNKPGDENDGNKNVFKTKYVIFQVNIRENGSNNNFDGKYYAQFAGIGYPIADTEKIMQYK